MPEPAPRLLAERLLERVIFATRWLLAPIYLGLAVSLVFLLVQFAQRIIDLARHVGTASGDEVIIGILSLVDLSLTSNLVLMVIFAGYESFVSRLELDDHRDRLEWMGRIGFADLKIKLMTSIVAISAIHVLENFMNLDHLSDRDLAWAVGIHLAFIVSGVLLAVMDRLGAKSHE